MLTRKEKDAIIFMSGCIGYLESGIEGFDSARIEARKSVEKVLTKISEKTSATNKDIEQLTTDIKKGKYKIEVVTQQDIKRRINEQKERTIRLKVDELDTILEHAMIHCTKECKRHKTKCALRKSMLKIGIETLHDEKGKCEFKP
jgi:predicted oxidoreductase